MLLYLMASDCELLLILRVCNFNFYCSHLNVFRILLAIFFGQTSKKFIKLFRFFIDSFVKRLKDMCSVEEPFGCILVDLYFHFKVVFIVHGKERQNIG